jgi:hypothetical protein
MHWEILIIPLIALGVWILSTLFKGGEDDRFKKGVRRPGDIAGRTPPRRPVTDLDRFLEEARQRREAEERRQAPPPPPIRSVVTKPPLRERSSPSRETIPPRPAPTAIRKGEAPVAIPAARPSRIEPVAVEAPITEAAPPAPIMMRESRPSPIVQQVHSLLSKPQTAGMAFILREIFAPPLCRRRR